PPVLADRTADADGKPGSVPGFRRRRDRGFREIAAGWRASRGCRSARGASAWRGEAPGGVQSGGSLPRRRRRRRAVRVGYRLTEILPVPLLAKQKLLEL